jgi:hypothetical protein
VRFVDGKEILEKSSATKNCTGSVSPVIIFYHLEVFKKKNLSLGKQCSAYSLPLCHSSSFVRHALVAFLSGAAIEPVLSLFYYLIFFNLVRVAYSLLVPFCCVVRCSTAHLRGCSTVRPHLLCCLMQIVGSTFA